MMMKTLLQLALLALTVAPLGAFAEQVAPAPLPEWNQLTAAQREVLIAPMRERWNASPEERARMLQHAQRWQAMTPEQRARARKGMHRWEGMPTQDRMQARRIFGAIRGMTPEQRKAFMEQWKTMSPAQREVWLKAHAPPLPPPPRD